MFSWIITIKIEALTQSIEQTFRFKGLIPWAYAHSRIRRVYLKTLETLEIYNVMRQGQGKDGKRPYKVTLRMEAGDKLAVLKTDVIASTASRAKYLAKANVEASLNVTIIKIKLENQPKWLKRLGAILQQSSSEGATQAKPTSQKS